LHSLRLLAEQLRLHWRTGQLRIISSPVITLYQDIQSPLVDKVKCLRAPRFAAPSTSLGQSTISRAKNRLPALKPLQPQLLLKTSLQDYHLLRGFDTEPLLRSSVSASPTFLKMESIRSVFFGPDPQVQVCSPPCPHKAITKLTAI
jgi:hypothetical protein